MQIGESISIAMPHSEGMNSDCPFCPIEKDKNYTTYSGIKNKSKTLENLMSEPKDLQQQQKGAWPHDGEKHEDRKSLESQYVHPVYGYHEFQAHHLISGKQALKDHVVEKWILKSKKHIEEDTGYTVNGSLNGLWAPSWPKSFREGGDYAGQWVTESIDTQEVADFVMAKAGCQFHLGGHSIEDPKDKDETQHQRYDNWLKKELTRINLRMWGWSRKCPLCSENGERKKPPFQPNHKINEALNRLSASTKRVLTANRSHWFIFLSKLALNYHSKACTHPIPGKQSKRT